MNKQKSTYTPRIGSETFGTSVMKTDEAFLFCKAGIDNGADQQTALDDMHMIDNMLHLKRLHIAVHGAVSKTKSGFFRKGTHLYDAYNDMLNGRVNNK